MKRMGIGALLGLVATSVWAARTDDIAQLLTEEVPFTAAAPTAPGDLVRLELTADIAAGCRPDLSDLRVFDGDDHEVPFMVYSFEEGVTAPVKLDKSVVVKPRAVTRSETAQASGPPLRTELYELPIAPGGPWMLQIAVPGEFVAHVDIDDKRAVNDYVPLVKGASIFRLEEHSRDIVDLPAAATTLRVKLTGQSAAYLAPRFVLVKTETYARRSITVPLEISATQKENHKTVLEVRRPGALMPLDVTVQTSTPLSDRHVEVFAIASEGDAAGTQQTRILGARIFRMPALGDVESLSLPIGRQTAEHLRIEIDDEDSPPLKNLKLTAVIANPILVFARIDHGTVRFGGGRAFAPHYDVANMTELKWLFDPARQDPVYRLPAAVLGAAHPNPRFNPAPLLGYAMRAGAPVDTHRYSHRRSLTIPPSTDGLSRFYLEPDDLAILRSDVSDLRIVDGSNRQWPFLVDANGRASWQRLAAAPPNKKGTASTYDLKLPAIPFSADQMRLDPAEPFFSRTFSLEASGDGATSVAAAGLLERRDQRAEGRPPRSDHPIESIAIPVGVRRASALTLAIEDGENAPLTLDHADVHITEPAVYVVAPAGSYALLMGTADDEDPKYDIASVRDEILAVAALPATRGPLERNADFRLSARLASDTGKQELFLWSALGLAVLLLGAFTLRMARHERDAA